MLAYIFWHWPAGSVPAAEYQARLASFEEVLATDKPPGLIDAAVWRIASAPWLAGSPVYENWYLLEGSAAMDPLNDWAVSGSRTEPHDRAASLAAGGSGGLYRLRSGAWAAPPVELRYWFAKPAGMRYPELFAAFERIAAEPGAGFWGRQMTLGPATEFCLAVPRAVELPAGISAIEIRAERIWPR